ncbi:MAG: hypothetical protein GEV05_27390 [Betaproteobacteria bacterium]|nr:hypothetical protein [Betaproteobacteria bacterium]
MTDDLARELIAELRALRLALEIRRTAPDAATVEFLAAVHAATGGAEFTSGDLAALALHAAPLAAAIRGVARSTSARTIGRALHRLDGREIGGYCIERLRVERDGAIWRVCGDCGFVTALAVAADASRRG